MQNIGVDIVYHVFYCQVISSKKKVSLKKVSVKKVSLRKQSIFQKWFFKKNVKYTFFKDTSF